MANDAVRADIDAAFSRVLGLPSLDDLRAELADEPIITLRPLTVEEVALQPDDELQFELL